MKKIRIILLSGFCAQFNNIDCGSCKLSMSSKTKVTEKGGTVGGNPLNRTTPTSTSNPQVDQKKIDEVISSAGDYINSGFKNAPCGLIAVDCYCSKIRITFGEFTAISEKDCKDIEIENIAETKFNIELGSFGLVKYKIIGQYTLENIKNSLDVLDEQFRETGTHYLTVKDSAKLLNGKDVSYINLKDGKPHIVLRYCDNYYLFVITKYDLSNEAYTIVDPNCYYGGKYYCISGDEVIDNGIYYTEFRKVEPKYSVLDFQLKIVNG